MQGSSVLERGKPILLMHCLECDSSIFLTNTPQYSIGFILADQGLDVWLGNTRGTHYSLKHTKFTTLDPEFWDFSWQEMASFDLPSCVDYILTLTGYDKMFYLGHSQGSMIAFAQMSQDPQLQSKIEKAYMLSPFVTLQRIQSYVTLLLEAVEYAGPYIHNRSFLPFSHDFLSRAAVFFCPTSFTHICTFVYYQFSGYSSYEYLNASRFAVYFSHALSGTSLKNVRHYAQLHLGKKPKLFDHMNSTVNFKKYGSEDPPEVDVTNVHTPVALFAGQNDWLVSSLDIQYLLDRLPNVFLTKNCSDFAHIDFMWGMHAVDCVYNSIVQDIMTS